MRTNHVKTGGQYVFTYSSEFPSNDPSFLAGQSGKVVTVLWAAQAFPWFNDVRDSDGVLFSALSSELTPHDTPEEIINDGD